MSINSSSNIYTDLNALHNLKSSARKDAGAALPEVARQFESVMISMMIKGLRKTGMKDPLFSSQAMDSYRDMYDQQLAMELSKGQGIGLAKSIVEQVQAQAGLVKTGTADPQSLKMPKWKAFPDPYQAKKSPSLEKSQINQAADEQTVEAKQAEPVQGVKTGNISEFEQPLEFVQKLWPLAEQTAKKLGVSTEVILSQAALETGWGQYIITKDKQSSFNLFNIKAEPGWSGKRMEKVSMEYAHGKPIQQKSSFRAYDSFEQSFNDYADFIQNSPRYRNALDKIRNMEQSLHSSNKESNEESNYEPLANKAYINTLHQSGYATDPDYSAKVLRVLNSDFIQAQVQINNKMVSN